MEIVLITIDYVFASRTNGNSVAYVRMLINDHHVMFTELYPECNVIPKMHYMVHLDGKVNCLVLLITIIVFIEL